jgi:hypothetical protein
VIQGTFGVIQGTSGVIQGTFGVIQGTFGVIQGNKIIFRKKKKKMTLGWVVNGEKTPRWPVGGIDPPRQLIPRGNWEEMSVTPSVTLAHPFLG